MSVSAVNDRSTEPVNMAQNHNLDVGLWKCQVWKTGKWFWRRKPRRKLSLVYSSIRLVGRTGRRNANLNGAGSLVEILELWRLQQDVDFTGITFTWAVSYDWWSDEREESQNNANDVKPTKPDKIDDLNVKNNWHKSNLNRLNDDEMKYNCLFISRPLPPLLFFILVHRFLWTNVFVRCLRQRV
jgi:hypothetical protein